ncbi:hypothetical protein LSM04_002161 [Trypanosoma melophagium]|uniref:uncharacterized protein n=1 Tax=Trypanosoma melophagium TaxID=715481 RepID=UPI00351A4BFC|nr:hypothetical protein LSM04_002161 [Trypanosoma melophagium]
MIVSPNVDDLSARFREMSERRDRLLGDRGKTWLCSEDQSSYGNVITVPLEFNSYRRNPQHSFQSTRSVKPCTTTPIKRGSTTPVIRRTYSYKKEMLDDDDLLPFATKSTRSACRNYSRNNERLNGIERKPTFRWINDDSFEVDQSRTVKRNPREKSENQVNRSFIPSYTTSQRRPSPLLLSLVNDIATRREVRSPPIPQEVIIAFETHVAHGGYMLKFVSNGAPHERFFVIKFLDRQRPFIDPEPALCWYRSSKSWTMQRCLPLADLIAVIDGGEDHPAVKKRMVHPGFIKGSYVNLKSTFLRSEFILQWHFRSSGGDEEILAVKMLDRPSYLSWYIVMNFFSSIGSVLALEP